MEASYAPLARAYEKLQYDTGGLSLEESAKFASLGVAPPKGFVALAPKDPQAVILDTIKGKVGVVFFPEAKKPGDLPGAQVLQNITRKLKELRPQVALLIGVSPWGVQSESDFLEKSKPDLDVLLGSGTGVGFQAKPSDNGRVLWMHTYTKGKAVYTIDVLALPGAKDFKWQPGKNFSTKAVILDESFTPDPAMEQALQGVQDPGETKAP